VAVPAAQADSLLPGQAIASNANSKNRNHLRKNRTAKEMKVMGLEDGPK